MSDSLGLYLNEIGKFTLLTGEDEKVLARQIEEGHEAAELFVSGEAALRRQEAQARLGDFTVTAAKAVEARDFIGRMQATGSEAEQEQRDQSPYLSLLRDVVEVDDMGIQSLKKNIMQGARAKDRFIRSNLRLVVSIAKRYPLPQGMDLGDLIQEGNLGLEHAVDKFDWRRGFKFSTYATFWIRQAIGRALDQKGSLIRIPGDRAAALRAALRQTAGDSEALDADNTELHRMTAMASLDRTLGDDGDATLGDMVPDDRYNPEKAVMVQVEDGLTRELLDILDERARYAVAARFGLLDGERRSFREIGAELRITPEAARRLVKRSIERLRSAAGKSGEEAA